MAAYREQVRRQPGPMRWCRSHKPAKWLRLPSLLRPVGTRHADINRSQSIWLLSLFRIELPQPLRWILEVPRPLEFDRSAQRTRDIEYLFLKAFVPVELLMRRGIGLHVADIAVAFGHRSCRNQFH